MNEDTNTTAPTTETTASPSSTMIPKEEEGDSMMDNESSHDHHGASASSSSQNPFDRSSVQVFDKKDHLGPDGKRLCSFGGAICTQRPMKNYDFCVKHILQDPSAPFKQCDYVVSKNSNKLCANPVKMTLNQDTRYCNAHKQMLGLIPKGSGQYSKKRKQQMASEKKSSSKRSRKQMLMEDGSVKMNMASASMADDDDNSETESDDDNSTEVMPIAPQPKRGKKRRLLNRKQMMTFHEDYFHSIEGDSETDSDVPTDEDNFESSNLNQGSVSINNSRFSSMRQSPFFARQLMQMAAQQQASGAGGNNILSQMLSSDYVEKHLMTKEEYLKMRRDQISKLLLIYQRQHSKLKRSLKSKYKRFILQKEQMLNNLSVAGRNEKLNVRLKSTETTRAPSKPLFEYPDENAQIYTCEKVEKVNNEGIPLCSYAQCNNKRMLCSDFCFRHILYDHNQRLYKAGSTGVSDPVLCAAPSSGTKKESTTADRKTIAIISKDEPLIPFDTTTNTNMSDEQTLLGEMIKQYQDLKANTQKTC